MNYQEANLKRARLRNGLLPGLQAELVAKGGKSLEFAPKEVQDALLREHRAEYRDADAECKRLWAIEGLGGLR